MNKLLPLAILILIALACSSSNENRKKAETTGVFASSNLKNLQQQIEASVKMHKKWESVDVTKLETNAITLHLSYKGMPSSMSEVNQDTDEIARAVLAVLTKQGYDPKKEWLALFVHAQRHERGASGSSVVRRFGKTSYDFNNDSLTFSQAGSFY